MAVGSSVRLGMETSLGIRNYDLGICNASSGIRNLRMGIRKCSYWELHIEFHFSGNDSSIILMASDSHFDTNRKGSLRKATDVFSCMYSCVGIDFSFILHIHTLYSLASLIGI